MSEQIENWQGGEVFWFETTCQSTDNNLFIQKAPNLLKIWFCTVQ